MSNQPTTDKSIKDVASELLSGSTTALVSYSNLNQSLAPREAAQMRGELIYTIYNHAQATFEIARAIALEAWLNRDWEYIEGVSILPDNMILTFKSLLEHLLPEANDDRGNEMRHDWIHRLSIEIVVLRGPLAANPINPENDKDAQTIMEVRDILEKANDQIGLGRLDALLSSGDPIDQRIFDLPGATASAREIVSDLRDRQDTPQSRQFVKKMALLAYTAKQETLRAYRSDTGLAKPRLNRYSIQPELVDVVNEQTGELIEQYVLVPLRFPITEIGLLEYLTPRVRPIFQVGTPISRTERVVITKENNER